MITVKTSITPNYAIALCGELGSSHEITSDSLEFVRITNGQHKLIDEVKKEFIKNIPVQWIVYKVTDAKVKQAYFNSKSNEINTTAIDTKGRTWNSVMRQDKYIEGQQKDLYVSIKLYNSVDDQGDLTFLTPVTIEEAVERNFEGISTSPLLIHPTSQYSDVGYVDKELTDTFLGLESMVVFRYKETIEEPSCKYSGEPLPF